MSKGSKRRPQKIPAKKFDGEWDRIFGKAKKFETEADMYKDITGRESTALK